jgi:hypothetical protein
MCGQIPCHRPIRNHQHQTQNRSLVPFLHSLRFSQSLIPFLLTAGTWARAGMRLAYRTFGNCPFFPCRITPEVITIEP